jgi:hypothetical protein
MPRSDRACRTSADRAGVPARLHAGCIALVTFSVLKLLQASAWMEKNSRLPTECRQKRANADESMLWRGSKFSPLSEQSEGDSF